MRCLLAASVIVSSLAAQQIPVSSHTLANGMKVLIHEDHDVPNIALYLFFRVGSRNERPGVTGMSHFFEHMMFNGAKKYGPKQFDIQMEANGGFNNAYTSRDVTVYTDFFAKTALALVLDMEADRIRDLAFDPKMVESERGVVFSERRLRVEDSSEGALYEQVNAAAFTAHPYGWPVIGWASDIEAWTMDDLKAHFRMGYAPNNCVAVIAGDVTEAAALALATKYLEPIPRQDPPPAVRTKEPEQNGERRVVVEKEAEAPLWMASYPVPRTADAGRLPLEMLGRVLAAGRSSRLYRRLVTGDQTALTVSAEAGDSLDPGNFLVQVELRPGVDPAAAERAVFDEIAKVIANGVQPQELEKAANGFRVELYRQMSTIAGKADLLGQFEVFHGDHRKLFGLDAAIAKLAPADLQQAAAKYLATQRRTVGVLVPVKETSK